MFVLINLYQCLPTAIGVIVGAGGGGGAVMVTVSVMVLVLCLIRAGPRYMQVLCMFVLTSNINIKYSVPIPFSNNHFGLDLKCHYSCHY